MRVQIFFILITWDMTEIGQVHRLRVNDRMKICIACKDLIVMYRKM